MPLPNKRIRFAPEASGPHQYSSSMRGHTVERTPRLGKEKDNTTEVLKSHWKFHWRPPLYCPSLSTVSGSAHYVRTVATGSPAFSCYTLSPAPEALEPRQILCDKTLGTGGTIYALPLYSLSNTVKADHGVPNAFRELFCRLPVRRGAELSSRR